MILHLKTVFCSFLLACTLLYISMMFAWHYDTEISHAQLRNPSSLENSKNSLVVLTGRPKRKRTPVTVPSNIATFIMLEARQISDHFEYVFWTLINDAYLELTLNWLCQTSEMTGVHERVFIITTRENTASEIRRHWPLISVLSVKSKYFNSSMIWGQKEYTEFLVFRASLIRLFVNNDVRFVLFETDSIWLRNPVQYFSNYSTTGDVIVPKKHKTDAKGRDLTFDPLLVFPNLRSKSFFTEMYLRLINPGNHVNGTLHDQDIMDDLCKVRFADVRCKFFPWHEVADGNWFKLSDRKRADSNTYVVNNNFYIGITNKITRQALYDFWYLNTDGKCDHEKVRKVYGNK